MCCRIMEVMVSVDDIQCCGGVVIEVYIGEFSWQCEKMVDEYVPAVLLDLESRLGPDKLCFESGLCTSSALSVHANEKKSCTVCQDLATDALTYLEKNKTQEEIVVALHLACAQLKELSRQVKIILPLNSCFDSPQIL